MATALGNCSMLVRQAAIILPSVFIVHSRVAHIQSEFSPVWCMRGNWNRGLVQVLLRDPAQYPSPPSRLWIADVDVGLHLRGVGAVGVLGGVGAVGDVPSERDSGTRRERPRAVDAQLEVAAIGVELS